MPGQSANHAPAEQGASVLVVEDDADTRRFLTTVLKHGGHRVSALASGQAAVAAIGSEIDEDTAAVCLDLGLGDLDGLQVMKHLHSRLPHLSVIVVTAARELDTAVAAMRSGAYDYLTKPVDPERLLHSIARAVERHTLSAEVRRLSRELGRARPHQVIGDSGPMRELGSQIARVLDSDVPVCVMGESGTGKELIARHIHDAGRRAARPFVAINCASIPVSLQESELFGHERGAFTGATGVHRGRFEQASGGTLFLDEVGEMSPATQSTLLRTLQERSIRRVGGSTEIAVDVRVISATHRDLDREVEEGRFRRDLYFRLVVFPLYVPPLRARAGDLPHLVAHFLAKHQGARPAIHRLSADALEALSAHSFPGNVRELENLMQRAILSCDGEEIQLGHLPPAIRQLALQAAPPKPASSASSVAPKATPAAPVGTLGELEQRAIVEALERAGGNVGAAAKLLGIGRTTLYRRLASLGIRTS